jgi:ribonucleotide monophosphatase NagD (HAD superfamily)
MEHNTNDSKMGNKVEDRLSNMSEDKKEDILSSFENFKSYLGDKVEKADKLGLNEEQKARAAQKVGDYLANHEEPKNREEKLLYELWKAGDKEEQHMLSHMLVKLVS